MKLTKAELKELSDRLWNERVLFSSKGDPIIFRMHFDSAIREAIEFQQSKDTDG